MNRTCWMTVVRSLVLYCTGDIMLMTPVPYFTVGQMMNSFSITLMSTLKHEVYYENREKWATFFSGCEWKKIKKNKQTLVDWSKQSTFTASGTSLFSFVLAQFKKCAIKTLIHRVYHLCSNYTYLHNELSCIKSFFFLMSFSWGWLISLLTNFLLRCMSPVSRFPRFQNLNTMYRWLAKPDPLAIRAMMQRVPAVVFQWMI